MDMKHYNITEIEGIGETYGHKLNVAGVRTTGDLLAKPAPKKVESNLLPKPVCLKT